MVMSWRFNQQTTGMLVDIPGLVNRQKTMENHHAIHGKTHYFDWAIFNSYVANYQRVNLQFIGKFNNCPLPCLILELLQ